MALRLEDKKTLVKEVSAVAGEALLGEEEAVEVRRALGVGRARREPRADLGGEGVETSQVRRDVQPGILLGRDQQRRSGQIDLAVLAPGQLGEAFTRVENRHARP